MHTIGIGTAENQGWKPDLFKTATPTGDSYAHILGRSGSPLKQIGGANREAADGMPGKGDTDRKKT